MVALASHGGRCCGIKHIYNMGTGPNLPDQGNRRITTKERLIQFIEEIDEFILNPDDEDADIVYNDHRVKEIVLADYQMHDGWPEALAELGFKRVASFLNSNSGNTCHVFYLHPDLTLYGNEPQPALPARVQVREVEVPVLPERREILVEYFPNFRVGGRGRPFSSVQEVREHAPLVRRIERRTVFSDGSITWEDV